MRYQEMKTCWFHGEDDDFSMLAAICSKIMHFLGICSSLVFFNSLFLSLMPQQLTGLGFDFRLPSQGSSGARTFNSLSNIHETRTWRMELKL
jgi:hypothetical protein